MYDENVSKTLALISPSDRVLDIGGWARPFNRANYVMDIGEYDSRGMFGSQGPEQEHFSRDTWIVRDLCDRMPYPFPDKSLDFVICSHTLEDIRDPIWVCTEMNRIARRGYIEVPSMLSELSRGVESKRYAGRSHHRWMIVIEDGCIVFTFKYHSMHSNWKHQIPSSITSEAAPGVQYMFWEQELQARENVLLTTQAIQTFYESEVSKYYEYPQYKLRLDALKSGIRSLRQLFRK